MCTLVACFSLTQPIRYSTSSQCYLVWKMSKQWCHYSLVRSKGCDPLFSDKAGWVSATVAWCALSWIWGVQMRGGTRGVWSFCNSSETVLVGSGGDGLGNKRVQDMSTEVWRAGEKSSDTRVIWGLEKIPNSRLILYMLWWDGNPSLSLFSLFHYTA